MKKKILIGMFVLSVVCLFQTKEASAQVKFGPIAGLNMADMTGDINSDGMIIGAHVGGFVNLPVTSFLMVEPQLLFSMKGAKGPGDDLRMNWIEIPVWARYELDNGLNFNAGPFLGFLISADAGGDVKDNFKSLDFGLGGGIGYQMSGGLGFHLNYNVGFANIGEEYDVPFLGTIRQDAKTACLKLSVSYMLGGKRE